ncbi:hypothetical protein Pmani_038968 [Petrolisthes manimaculis]|uniref:Uncharacterized protein n=1 Tax=Petrolisthes manimaculis TaxID=1843537 RepID=A0AAE1NF51_9EUCA|nr:hypothetical protein Pmani_038968 [Petrolisthes manimaculis]
MKMDSIPCEFPHSTHGPITPPATPTQDMARTPTFSSCSDPRYSHHDYAQTEFAHPEYVTDSYSSQVSTDSFTSQGSTDSLSSQGSSDIFPESSSSSSASSTHALSPPESPLSTPKGTPTHTPLSSTPTRRTKDDTKRSRKNSFVYDVRLTDEQFLFFVPDFDLVKSHLMFAVREEVEVLKEKITELMDRISQLEYENMVLRQYATQEALQQLQQPHHPSNT